MEENKVSAQLAVTVLREGAEVHPGGELLDKDLYSGKLSVVAGRPRGVSLVRNHSFIEEAMLLSSSGAGQAAGRQPFEGSLSVHEGVPGEGWSELWLRGRAAQNGSPLTSWAFRRGLAPLGDWGHLLVTLAVFLFGISTAISWSYYGDRSVTYLIGRRAVLPYRLVYVLVNFLGAIFSLEVVWAFGDTALGMMALPNLIAVLLLLPVVKKLSRDYFSREHVVFPRR